MERAESLMEENPELALTTLDSISVDDLTTKKDKARYALLMSMALDKNYIDTTTFDVLQPAIDYYLKKGNPDERLRTLYYQGRILQTRGEDEKAMASFIEGIDLKAKVTDSLTLARLYSAESFIFKKQGMNESEIRSSLCASALWHELGYILNEIQCLTHAINANIVLERKEGADSLLVYADSLIQRMEVITPIFLHSKIMYSLDFLQKNTSKLLLDSIGNKLLDSIRNDKWEKELTLDLAYGYQKLGLIEEASRYLDRTGSVNKNNRLKYLVIKSDVERSKGNYYEALLTTDEMIALSDSINSETFSQEVASVETKYISEKKAYDAKIKKEIAILICIILFLLMLIVGNLGIRLFRRLRNRNWILSKENRLLDDRTHFLSNENKSLIMERNRLKSKNTYLKETNSALNHEKNKVIEETNSLRYENQQLEDKNNLMKLHIEHLKGEKIRVENQCDQYLSVSQSLQEEIAKIKEEVEILSQKLSVQKKISDALKIRDKKSTGILAGYLAAKITSDKRYGKELSQLEIDIFKNKERFLNRLREILEGAYPEFMSYLGECRLSSVEMRYVCLYALGLSGQEVGTYLETKRYYVISSSIRKKLKMNSTDTNIRLHIQSFLR